MEHPHDDEAHALLIWQIHLPAACSVAAVIFVLLFLMEVFPMVFIFSLLENQSAKRLRLIPGYMSRPVSIRSDREPG